MSKECPNPYLAQEKRIRFVEGIVGEGVLDKIPLSERNQNIGIIACLTEMPYQQLGKMHLNPLTKKPLTGSRIGQIVDMFLRKSWAHASTCLQAAYPREEILMKKLSLPEDGPGLRIKEAMERGISDPKQLRKLAGSSNKLTYARKSLERRGIKVPFIREYAGFEAEAAAETDDQKLQAMLSNHSDGSLRGYLNHHRKDKNRTLLDLSTIVKSAGLRLRSNLLYLIEESIERYDKHLPRRKIKGRITKTGKSAGTYHIVYAKHQERIIAIIKNDPNLQRFKQNPVRLICGTFWGKIPTTTELTRLTRKGKEYTNIAPLIKEVAGQRLNKTKREEYLRGCPVPVFRLKNCHFYLKSQVGELETFLKSAINH